MCVIMASDTAKPTQAMMEAGWDKNPYGAGVAWQEKDKKGAIWMRWVKGITDVKDVIKLVAERTLGEPLVVHFRIPTEGLGDISLTHPFPVSLEVPLDFEGKTRNTLLFHNGGWGNWRNFSLETAQKAGRKLPPDGMLSDSRMMAWNVDFYGKGILQLIGEKVILFGPQGIESFGQVGNGGWEYDREAKIWFSNSMWKHYMPRPTQSGGSASNHSTDGSTGGSRPQASFRPYGEHGSGNARLLAGRTVEQQVEGREAHPEALTQQDREVVGRDGQPAIRRPLTADPAFRAEVRKLGEISPASMADWLVTRRVAALHAEQVVT